MKDQQTEQLLTRKEVAEMFKVSYPTLKSWRDRGLITAHKIGKTVRFKLEDVQESMGRARL